MPEFAPAVGLYWTLPVPWVGFRDLPRNVDDAAKISRTIRYQRDMIRRYAKDHGLTLVHEEIWLELAPDRASRDIGADLRKVEAKWREQGAILLLVDFAAAHGWRSHMPLLRWAEEKGIEVRQIPPDETFIDGKLFQPDAHFSQWREKQQAWIASKPAREAARLSRARALRADGLGYAKIATAMNDANELNLTGKRWTAENIRKFLLRDESEG